MRLIDADAFERAVMFSDDEDIQDVIYRLRDFPTIEQPHWIPCVPTDGYIISHHLLTNNVMRILVTYKTKTGKRHVTSVWCNKGRIVSSRPKGDIIAWMPLPEVYRGE